MKLKLFLLLLTSWISVGLKAEEKDSSSFVAVLTEENWGVKEFRCNTEIPAVWLYQEWNTDELYSCKLTAEEIEDSIYLFLVDTLESTFHMPVKSNVTSNFGWRSKRHHSGIDLDLITGDTVSSAFDGVVRFAKYYGAFGNLVIVRHYNGLETLYAHLSRINVKPGDKVKAGELLGLGGNTGRSTGSHLHFEVRFRGLSIDPNYLIDFNLGETRRNSFFIHKGLFNHSRNEKIPSYRRYSVKSAVR